MSRYLLNKLMWEVDLSDAALGSFKANTDRFLDDWEASSRRPVPPYPKGGELTGEERQAIQRRDYGSLYAMGVNPFLLWQFARSVSVPDEVSLEDLVASFRESVEPHGYPNFFT
jgi:Aromatic-ring-opening dioxygenase LigAB, LigA subunit